jgi:hypothetical protein
MDSICESCRQVLTPDTSQSTRKSICRACVIKRLAQGRFDKKVNGGRAEAEHALKQILHGPYYNIPTCPSCAKHLLPGTAYRHHPTCCKRCFDKDEKQRMGPIGNRTCKECRREQPLTNYYTHNKNRCKACVKKHALNHQNFAKTARLH